MKNVIIFAGAFFVGALVAFAGIFLLAVNTRNMENDTYVAAMEEYREVINADEVDIKKITELADSISSDGDYALVEQASKQYIRDVFVPYLSARQTQKKAPYTGGINRELIESNQPNFEKTIATFKEMEEEITLVRTVGNTLFSHEAALEYMYATTADEIDEFYIGLFEEQTAELYDDQEMRENYITYANYMQLKTDQYRAVINFLINHNGAWHLEGDAVVFRTTALTNEYNQLLAQISQE